MKIKSMLLPFLGMIFFLTAPELSGQKNYTYESIPNDPLNTRIYTLENGMKVFLTVYKDAPRIQTFIAVKTGSKNDPPETTGLAHYLEHMLFKGTTNFGTTNWDHERPKIEAIENLFEVYRNTKDEKARVALYHKIDSISYEASKLAIPNEYDKLMNNIGSTGSNAGTSDDNTYFMENIPSNRVETWAEIEAERFTYPVFRLFHTELEAVYEEKNMSLTNDSQKAEEAMMKALFPNHPYGRQTTLGETEHLKNPSMKSIRKFYNTYYVPNNMAIIMSGDFDPEAAIKIIDKYFNKFKSKDFPALKFDPYHELTAPVVKEITGVEAESTQIGFGFDLGASSENAKLVEMIALMLSNGKAGLIDLNLNQKQLVLSAECSAETMADYSYISFMGRPKSGQKLEEVKDLMLGQLELLKKGDFPDWMLKAAINNMKLSQMKHYESNYLRARTLLDAFTYNIPYNKVVSYIDDISKITKKQIVDFANKYLKDNYVVIYKKEGKPEEVKKITKPPITPIVINRNLESEFMKKIKAITVPEIEPVFLDYDKDLAKFTIKNNVRVLYKENTENKTFSLVFNFQMGSNNDKMMDLAISYLNFLGVTRFTSEQLKQEFYKLACNFSVSSTQEETNINLSGLSENFEQAFRLVQEVLADVQPNKEAYSNMVDDILKSRADAKSNQKANFSALQSYATFGPESPVKNILPDTILRQVVPEDLVGRITMLLTYPHQILYYGPMKQDELNTFLTKYHRSPRNFQTPDTAMHYTELETGSSHLLFAPYDAKQAYVQTIIREGKYDKALIPVITLYNNYFGSNIVFQEMREKRALAYTARSSFSIPPDREKYSLNTCYIATQSDKTIDAIAAFDDLIDNMPASDITFEASRKAVISDLRTKRVTKMGVISNFLAAEKQGLKEDIRKDIFKQVPKLSLDDLKSFNARYLKGKTKTYLILAKEKDMDFKALLKYGPLKKLTQQDIFGY